MKTAILQVADTKYRTIEWSPNHQVGSDGSLWTKSRFGPKNGERRGEYRRLKTSLDKDGYPWVCFNIQGVRYYRHVHTLVLQTFVGLCPEGMEACHQDGDEENNHLSNLRWDTHSNNNQEKWKHGTQQTGDRNGNHKLTWDQVQDIRRRIGGPYGTLMKTSREFGISRKWVRMIWDNEVRTDR